MTFIGLAFSFSGELCFLVLFVSDNCVGQFEVSYSFHDIPLLDSDVEIGKVLKSLSCQT